MDPKRASASAVRPTDSSQRGDSGSALRRYQTTSAPNPPSANMARQPKCGMMSVPRSAATGKPLTTMTFMPPSPRAQITSVLTVTNMGTAPLNIGGETLLPFNTTFFTVTGNTCANTTVAVNGTCTVSV